MTSAWSLELTLLPGSEQLLADHANELPQRDDLCGAFCAALALRAAGIRERASGPIDQDEVALAAGSVVSGVREPGTLPGSERGRRDYRLALPTVADAAASGTTAAGVVRAVEELSDGRLAAMPLAGPWPPRALDGVFEAAAGLAHPATLVANLATRHLWGGRASAAQLLAALVHGSDDGPAPDWDVGHFACIVGRVAGPGGALYAVADTYPSLGAGGVHMQPRERLSRAIERRDMPAGGVIAVVAREDAEAVRSRASELGVQESIWDNGTVPSETPA
jgi:hypothetical protein